MTFSNLHPRVITGAALVAGLILLELFSRTTCFGRVLFISAALVFVLFAAYEFANFGTHAPKRAIRFLTYLLLTALPSLIVFGTMVTDGACGLSYGIDYSGIASSAAGLSLILSLLFMVGEGRTEIENARDVALDLFPAVLLVGAGGALLVASATRASHASLFWLIGVVSINDIAAYFVGSKLQGAQLAPALSPKKTVSGAVGGLAVGVIVGVLFRGFSGIEGISGGNALLYSLIIIVSAQAADLGKSFLKRIHNVKDSGTLLPGHGGVLDRIDGLLGALIAYHGLSAIL